MSEEFLSRRQRRELEAQQAALAYPTAASLQMPAQPLYAPGAAPVVPAPIAQVPVATTAASYTPSVVPVAASNSAPVAPLSRRELRQQQQAPAPATVAPVSYSSTSWIQDVTPVVPVAPSAAPANSPAPAPAPVSAPAPAPATSPIPSRRELREQLRQPIEAVEPPVIPVTPFAQPWSELPVTPMFETSSGFSIDTTTNSVVLPVTPDALAGPLVIESGVTLRTGSIELPNLNAGTGSIAVPTAAQIADDAMSRDSANSFVSSIAPVAARNLLRKNPKLGLAPVKTKGTQGQLFYGLTTAFLMLTVGALLLAAWMYGVIK